MPKLLEVPVIYYISNKHLFLYFLLSYYKVSIPEIQRLWVRFQQLGCNNYGVLPSTALTVYDPRAEVDPHVALLQTVFLIFF